MLAAAFAQAHLLLTTVHLHHICVPEDMMKRVSANSGTSYVVSLDALPVLDRGLHRA